MTTTTATKSALEKMQQAINEDIEPNDSGWYNTHCPVQRNHKGGDKNPSFGFKECVNENDPTDRYVVVRCFGGCTPGEIVGSLGLTLADLYSNGSSTLDFVSSSKQAQQALTLREFEQDKLLPMDYLMLKAELEDSVCTFHKKDGTPYLLKGITFPYYHLDGSHHERQKLRTGLVKTAKQKNIWYWTEGDEKIIPYNLHRLPEAEKQGYLIIPEGESDTCTLDYHGFPALGVPGAKLENCLDGLLFSKIPRIYVMQEKTDEAGITFPFRVQVQLQNTGYTGEILRMPLRTLTGAKDPNELHKQLWNKDRPRDHTTFRNELQKVLAQSLPMNRDTANDEYLPKIIIGEQLRVTRDAALNILSEAHSRNPTLFIYQSTISKIERNEQNRPIVMQLGIAGLRNELTDIADFFQYCKGKKDEEGHDTWNLKDIAPPKELAEQILALAPSKWKLSPLRAIVETPVCRPDGTILDRPGYDPETQLYYVASSAMQQCSIAERPTQAEAIEAMGFIQQMYDDFLWEGPADRANAIGLLLTPFMRYAVNGDVQLALVDANNAGTGKGLITSIVAGVAIGEKPTVMRAEHDDSEWKKTIIAKLLEAPSIVVIDNIRGVLESASLEMMFTGGTIDGRILGISKMAKVKNQATWMATGNNLLIGGDLARRCYRIRLLSLTANPEERDDFKIADLEAWVLEHRVKLIASILTVIRAWYVAGKPKDKNVPKLATFTDWAQSIGGILAYAGVEGFQQNRDELRSRNNEEATEWEAFLSAWYQAFKSDWKYAAEVTKIIAETTDNEHSALLQPPANLLFETLPKDLKKAFTEKQKSFVVSLPLQLQKRVQTVYGIDSYKIETIKDAHTKVGKWRVVRGVAVGHITQRVDQKKDSHNNAKNNLSTNDGLELPQPSAEQNRNRASSSSRTGFISNLADDHLRGVAEEKNIVKSLKTAEQIQRETIASLLAEIEKKVADERVLVEWPKIGNDIYGPGKIPYAECKRRVAADVRAGENLSATVAIVRRIKAQVTK